MRFRAERQPGVQPESRCTDAPGVQFHRPGYAPDIADRSSQGRNGRLPDAAAAAIHAGTIGQELRGRLFHEESDGPLPQRRLVHHQALSEALGAPVAQHARGEKSGAAFSSGRTRPFYSSGFVMNEPYHPLKGALWAPAASDDE